LKIDETIFDLVRNSKGEVEKRYIFEIPEKSFRYTQYTFNWYKYLKALPFVKTSSDGKLYILDPAEVEKERQARLRQASAKLSSGSAYLSKGGTITSEDSGVQHRPHRFHYGK
jgi:hypothetical protein